MAISRCESEFYQNRLKVSWKSNIDKSPRIDWSHFFTFWMIHKIITRLFRFYIWVLRTRIRDERTRHWKRDFLALAHTSLKIWTLIRTNWEQVCLFISDWILYLGSTLSIWKKNRDLTRYKVRQEYWVMDGEICPCSCGTNKPVQPIVNGYKWIMVPE